MAQTSDNGDGLEPLRAVLRANPQSAVFVALTHRLCDAGREDEAEAICREGLRHQPELTTGRVALGRVLCARGKLAEAQEVLLEAARREDDNGDTFRWLGEVLLRRGDQARARSVLEYAELLCAGDARVAELLVEAGGTPSLRPTRPSSDFEHTKISDSRALALGMNDPEHERGKEAAAAAAPAAGASTSQASRAELRALALEAADPTVITPPRLRSDAQGTGLPLGDDATVLSPPPAESVWLQSKASAIAGDGSVPKAPAPASLPPVGASPTPEPAAPASGNYAWSVGAGSSPRPPGSSASWGSATRPVGPIRRRLRAALRPIGLHGDDPASAERRRVFTAGAVLVVLIASGLVATRPIARRTQEDGGLGPAMERAISLGTFAELDAVVAKGRSLLVDRDRSPEALADAAVAEGLLAADYGVLPRDRALGAALDGERDPAATVRCKRAASRALLALARGDLAEARSEAEQARVAAPGRWEGALAVAKTRLASGDLTGASSELQELVALTPELAPGVVEWAFVLLEDGHPSDALASLRPLVERAPMHARARILLAEAERAFGVGSAPTHGPACEVLRDKAPLVAAFCLIEEARRARLEGRRADAAKAARAASAAEMLPPRVLGPLALTLVSVGEIDEAARVAERMRAGSGPGLPSQAWALRSLALAQGQPPTEAVYPIRPSPEAHLVAAREAFARGGAAELAVALRALPPAVAEGDPDLRAFLPLARERPTRTELKTLLADADRNPVAAWTATLAHERLGDHAGAFRLVERALWAHADVCPAANLYVALARQLGRAPNVAALTPVRKQAAGCPALASAGSFSARR